MGEISGRMKLLCFILPCVLVSEVCGRALGGADDSGTSSGGGSDGGGRKKRGVDKPLMTKQVSTNCRTVVAININSPVVCSKMKLGNLLKFNAAFSPMWGHRTNKEGTEQIELEGEGSDPNWVKTDGMGQSSVDLENLPGKCRFDPYRAMVDPNSACLCVATQETCTKNRDGCYWHEDPDTHYKECISKAERFYNQLYALLSKRGKKSFAINIRYGATPARGNLPYGPWGPAIIGYGNPSPSQQIGLFRRPRPRGPPQALPFAPDQLPQQLPPPSNPAQQAATGQEAAAEEASNTDRQGKGGLGLLNMLQMTPSSGAYGTGGMGGMQGGMSGGMQGGMYGGMGGMSGGMGGVSGGMQGGMTGGMQGGMTGGMGSMSGGMGGMSGGMQGGMTGGMSSMHGGMQGGMTGGMGGMTGGMSSMHGGMQ